MAIDTVVEEVADNLEEIAEATRRINTNSVGFFLGGAAFGFAVGFYFGYKYNKEKLRAEVFAQSEKEVAKIREVYQQKTVAAMPKPDLDEAARAARNEAMEKAGYSAEERADHLRPLKPPVPGLVDPTPVSAPPVVIYDGGKDKNTGWDYPEELQHRLDGKPYIIHQDEFSEGVDGYNKVTYTYYAADDVLVDEENEQPLPHGDLVVGVDNLRFGHGSDDIDVVFVRNDELQIEMEICRSPESYEEKYLGVENSEDDDETESD